MARRVLTICLFIIFTLAMACSRQVSGSQLVVDVPSGFSGNFVLNMGVREAAPLKCNGQTCYVTVPSGGKVETSTFLDSPKITFQNGSDGSIWGFSQSVFTTGDGISVGGKIEFFVGTQKDFDAEQKKKNKSGTFSAPDTLVARV